MKLVSNYNGSDFASIEADNTSAFNCRFVDGTHKWSNHSYGRAIDINPIENPYVSNSGHTSHKKSYKFVNRVRKNSSAAYKAMILKSDKIVAIFKKYGWRWGGAWNCCKDYQHFDKKIAVKSTTATKFAFFKIFLGIITPISKVGVA